MHLKSTNSNSYQSFVNSTVTLYHASILLSPTHLSYNVNGLLGFQDSSNISGDIKVIEKLALLHREMVCVI